MGRKQKTDHELFLERLQVAGLELVQVSGHVRQAFLACAHPESPLLLPMQPYKPPHLRGSDPPSPHARWPTDEEYCHLRVLTGVATQMAQEIERGDRTAIARDRKTQNLGVVVPTPYDHLYRRLLFAADEGGLPPGLSVKDSGENPHQHFLKELAKRGLSIRHLDETVRRAFLQGVGGDVRWQTDGTPVMEPYLPPRAREIGSMVLLRHGRLPAEQWTPTERERGALGAVVEALHAVHDGEDSREFRNLLLTGERSGEVLAMVNPYFQGWLPLPQEQHFTRIRKLAGAMTFLRSNQAVLTYAVLEILCVAHQLWTTEAPSYDDVRVGLQRIWKWEQRQVDGETHVMAQHAERPKRLRDLWGGGTWKFEATRLREAAEMRPNLDEFREAARASNRIPESLITVLA